MFATYLISQFGTTRWWWDWSELLVLVYWLNALLLLGESNFLFLESKTVSDINLPRNCWLHRETLPYSPICRHWYSVPASDLPVFISRKQSSAIINEFLSIMK